MSYEIRFSKVAFKDVKNLTPKIQKKLKEIISRQLVINPYIGKRLVGDLEGLYSLRLTLKDRIVYSVDEKNQTIYIHRAKTHYGE